MPAADPLRRLREVAVRKLAPLQPLLLSMAASGTVVPTLDRGLMAMLLMTFYDLRSEGALCDELTHNEPFRWFLGLTAQDDQLEVVPLAQLRSRLLRNSAATEFLSDTIAAAGAVGLFPINRPAGVAP
jgi:hypothetical protein